MVSEAGGEPAREISVDIPCSDIAGVDGRLREMDDIEGCLEVCFNKAADKALERSVVAEAGVVSAFCMVPVVSRRVLGRLAVVNSGGLVLFAVGVFGIDSIAIGVSTIFSVGDCGSGFESNTPDFTCGVVADEMSSFPNGAEAFDSEGECLLSSDSFTVVTMFPAPVSSLVLSFVARRSFWLAPTSVAEFLVVEFTALPVLASAELLSVPAFEIGTSCVPFSGLGGSGRSFSFGLGLFVRWPIGSTGRAGVTGPVILLEAFGSFFLVSVSSLKDGKGCACGRLKPGGTRGVDERTG